jgi:O-acetyl-ADP-ribose deacetylase (regulator of RNase III)
MHDRISVVQADITRLDVDAIVNAANTSLLGGGVDGAIHRAAGPELLAACRPLRGCKVGAAKITPGFRLKAQYIIHTVGPVWRGGKNGEAELLASCHRESLRLAAEHDVHMVAFPAISCGAYCYPPDEAAAVAIDQAIAFLRQSALPKKIIFACFSDALPAYMGAIADRFG